MDNLQGTETGIGLPENSPENSKAAGVGDSISEPTQCAAKFPFPSFPSPTHTEMPISEAGLDLKRKKSFLKPRVSTSNGVLTPAGSPRVADLLLPDVLSAFSS
jgi:hypothetical protein